MVNKKGSHKNAVSRAFEVNKRWQDRKKGIVPPVDYSMDIDQAWDHAGLPG